MTKIISNRCDKQGNVYITLGDILGKAVHYDNDGKFEYIQNTSGDKYTSLQGMKMDFNLKLIDPTGGVGHNNIIAGDTEKSVEVKVAPGVNSCVMLNQEGISIDTMRYKCSIQKLLGTDDTVKINLKGDIKLNQEFAELGGTVNLSDQNYKWIDLGLNEYELSQHKIKVTDDCGCKPDTEAFKELRNDITVKQSEQKVGGVNMSAWYFQNGDFYYDLAFDQPDPGKIGDGTYYFKVIPCNDQKQYHELALCDKDGNVVTKTKGEAVIHISKCNLVGGENIELKDFVREDGRPSFIIKPSASKEFGEATNSKSRAEVYEYDPISDNTGDKVGKLNATEIRELNGAFFIHNFLLDDNSSKFFRTNSNNVIVKEEDGVYSIDKPFTSDAKITKLLLDDLLCLYDQNSLQDGIQIIG
ncbi:MAG: hypothetical protein U0X86_001165 [Wolbachia endosymbiont of Xenopsylla cheopis]